MGELRCTLTPQAPRSVAGIGAFRDHDRLRAALRTAFGADMPMQPGFIEAAGATLACLGPSRFMAMAERHAGLPARLAASLAGLAAITDQSDMWEVARLSGPHVREVLARLVPIDVQEATFRIGDLALTRAGHVDLRVFRIAETCYELAVARSYAADLWTECRLHLC